MKISPAPGLPDVLLIDPVVHGDERGFLTEVFRRDVMAFAGVDIEFVQENHSRSARGVLRGLHMQHPHGQGKRIRVVVGEVFDVAVDARVGSPTFGRWFGVRLSASNHRMLYIPPGFGHGFAVLSDVAELTYLCTEYYHPESEIVIAWDDPAVGIEWPVQNPTLSARDRAGLPLVEHERAGRLPRWFPA